MGPESASHPSPRGQLVNEELIFALGGSSFLHSLLHPSIHPIHILLFSAANLVFSCSEQEGDMVRFPV